MLNGNINVDGTRFYIKVYDVHTLNVHSNDAPVPVPDGSGRGYILTGCTLTRPEGARELRVDVVNLRKPRGHRDLPDPTADDQRLIGQLALHAAMTWAVRKNAFAEVARTQMSRAQRNLTATRHHIDGKIVDDTDEGRRLRAQAAAHRNRNSELNEQAAAVRRQINELNQQLRELHSQAAQEMTAHHLASAQLVSPALVQETQRQVDSLTQAIALYQAVADDPPTVVPPKPHAAVAAAPLTLDGMPGLGLDEL